MIEPPSPPVGGFQTFQQVPSKVHRRTAVSRPVFKRRTCEDNRAYVFIPFTIKGTIAATNYGPMWPVDRNYWVARLTLDVGRHDSATHPNDGTPSGQAIRANMRRVTRDQTGDAAILGSDSRLNVQPDHHRDAINDEEDGDAQESDFAIVILRKGEHIYPRFSQVGSGRPGTDVVITAVLVPMPTTWPHE